MRYCPASLGSALISAEAPEWALPVEFEGDGEFRRYSNRISQYIHGGIGDVLHGINGAVVGEKSWPHEMMRRPKY